MLAKGFFTGEASLPPMTATMYTLPEPMKCFDARVVNKNGDVILSCQAIDTSYEWVCFISAATSALECSNFPTAVVATWRKSAIIQLGKNIFLLSASKRDRISVITVYNLNSGKAQFNTVIDAAQLGLDSLLIVDFGIDSSGNLLIADGSADSPRLAVVRLDAVNPPMLLKVVALGSVPMAVHCTSIGTLFVATGSRIWEHRQNDFAVVNSYEVDQSDNEFL